MYFPIHPSSRQCAILSTLHTCISYHSVPGSVKHDMALTRTPHTHPESDWTTSTISSIERRNTKTKTDQVLRPMCSLDIGITHSKRQGQPSAFHRNYCLSIESALHLQFNILIVNTHWTGLTCLLTAVGVQRRLHIIDHIAWQPLFRGNLFLSFCLLVSYTDMYIDCCWSADVFI